MKAFRLFTSVSLAIAIVLTGNISVARQTQSNPKPSPLTLAARGGFPKPPNRRAPGIRSSAASRGCLTLAKATRDDLLDNLAALVPEYKEKSSTQEVTSVWGLTTAERPTFWFYIPYTNQSIDSVEFTLQDEQEQDLYKTTVTPPQTPGIVSIQLPANGAALQTGKLHHWYLKVKGKADCFSNSAKVPNTGLSSSDSFNLLPLVFVEGWVERVNPKPALIDRLKQVSPQQQTALYIENGFWYDAITSLAEQRLTNSTDSAVLAEWNALLKSVGLEQLAAQPLVKCCSAK